MARSPTLPRSKTNPIGQTKRIQRVRNAYRQDMLRARKRVLDEIDSWPFTVQNRLHGNAFYEYLIDAARLGAFIDSLVRDLAQGLAPQAASEAAFGAYREGTAKAVDNLRGISEDYPRTVTQRLGDQDVLRRASLAGTRAFEEMQGFGQETGRQLGRMIYQAVQDGENPRTTARKIRKAFGLSRTRAERIARTEIGMALRRGRWDEARDAQDKFGFETRLIHNSALIPNRTRRTHAARHGMVVTIQEEADWYAINGNAINCLCSQTEVLVDEQGKPVVGGALIERMKAARKKYLSTAAEGSV